MIRGYVRATSETVSAETQINDLHFKEGIRKDLITVEEGPECYLLKTMDLKSGNKLVVWRLDVLGFFTCELSRYLLDLHQRGIFIKSLQDGVDTEFNNQSMFVKHLEIIASNESLVKKEKIKSGLKRSFVGKLIAPRAITGEKEREVKMLIEEGSSKAEICRRLKINRKTFYNWEKTQ